MLFCLRCRAPQTVDSAKVTKRFFENVKSRQRILATAATGSNKPIEALLTSDLHNMGDRSKKRGQMSAEAATIRDAKDRRQRAAKLNFSSVAERYDKDEQLKMRMMQEGRNMEDMQKLDYLSYAVLPDLGRSEEQRPPQGRFALHVRWPVQFRDGALQSWSSMPTAKWSPCAA